MRSFLLAAAMVAIAGMAFGQQQQREGQDQQQQQRDSRQIQCKLFRVIPDQQQLTVIQGNFQQSGAGGSNKDQPDDQNAKRLTVKVSNRTNIHWQDRGDRKGERLTLAQLQRMSQQQIVIPMTVYAPRTAQADDDTPISATEIVLKGSPSRQNPESNENNNNNK